MVVQDPPVEGRAAAVAGVVAVAVAVVVVAAVVAAIALAVAFAAAVAAVIEAVVKVRRLVQQHPLVVSVDSQPASCHRVLGYRQHWHHLPVEVGALKMVAAFPYWCLVALQHQQKRCCYLVVQHLLVQVVDHPFDHCHLERSYFPGRNWAFSADQH